MDIHSIIQGAFKRLFKLHFVGQKDLFLRLFKKFYTWNLEVEIELMDFGNKWLNINNNINYRGNDFYCDDDNDKYNYE